MSKLPNRTVDTWEPKYRLGDGCAIKHGFAFKGDSMTTDASGNAPIVVNIVNFQYTGGFRFGETKTQRYLGAYPPEYRLQPGDVLLVMTCQTPQGEILGVPGRIPLDGRVYLHNQRMGLVVLKDSSKLDLSFLYYLFISRDFNQHLFETSTGAKILHTAPSRIENFRFTRPPLQTQQQIASILSAYDDLIENNTRRIKILEQMAQTLYREWFVNFRFPGHEKVKLVESEMGLIPEGWTPSSVGQLCGEVRRSVNPADIPANTPYIGLEHMPRKSIALSEWGEAGQVQSTKLRFLRGEILFGKIRPYFHKVGVAPVNGVCSSDAIVIVPKKPEFFPVVLFCVSSDDFVLQATQTSQGTKMPRANWGVLCKYPVALPPKKLLDRFGETTVPMIELINNLAARNRCLRTTRDLLLPKLVSGEVSVETLVEEALAETV